MFLYTYFTFCQIVFHAFLLYDLIIDITIHLHSFTNVCCDLPNKAERIIGALFLWLKEVGNWNLVSCIFFGINSYPTHSGHSLILFLTPQVPFDKCKGFYTWKCASLRILFRLMVGMVKCPPPTLIQLTSSSPRMVFPAQKKRWGRNGFF